MDGWMDRMDGWMDGQMDNPFSGLLTAIKN
jgi:hypothetical protein